MKKNGKVILKSVLAMTGILFFTLTVAVTTQAKVKILAGKKLTLTVGESDYVLVKGKGVTYTSSNKKIATVSKAGKVKAKGPGSCKILVKQGSERTTVKVTNTPKKVTMKSIDVIGSDYANSLAEKASVKVSWKKVKGATGYYIYYSKALNEHFKKITVKGEKKTSCVLRNLPYGNTYYVKVKAFGGKKKIASQEYSKVMSVKTYILKWNDEFNNSTMDATKWNPASFLSFGSTQPEAFNPDCVKAENGNLVIMPQFQYDSSTQKVIGNSWRFSRFSTFHSFSFKYGKVEVRAKLPKGQGIRAACWMLGDSGEWPKCGEIDVFESMKQIEKTSIIQAIHCQKYNGMSTSSGPKYFENNVATATSEFHTYGIEWTEDRIDFYIDGTKTGTYDPNKFDLNNKGTSNKDIWPFNENFHLYVDCQVGGNLGGEVTPTNWTKIKTNGNIETYQDNMFIDYVRVYQ